MKNEIKLFEERNVRTVWNEETTEEWYFSIVDVIEILTNTDRPRKYWNDLKKKLQKEGSELSEKIGQLKIPSTYKGTVRLWTDIDLSKKTTGSAPNQLGIIKGWVRIDKSITNLLDEPEKNGSIKINPGNNAYPTIMESLKNKKK